MPAPERLTICRELRVSLELPPSVNHSHCNVRRRSRAGKLYTAKVPTSFTRGWRSRAHVDLRNALVAQGWKTPLKDAKVVVEIWYYWPDESYDRDTHNRIKELMDALQRALVFTNDCTALAREQDYVCDPAHPRLELRVYPMAPSR
jgi:crossover junction endodeoxyribonuclease RusA